MDVTTLEESCPITKRAPVAHLVRASKPPVPVSVFPPIVELSEDELVEDDSE